MQILLPSFTEMTQNRAWLQKATKNSAKKAESTD
jgi:hypothetical protein